MLRIRILAITACVVAVSALVVRAQNDDLKALLKKAIAAHGGEKLQKFGAATSKYKGTIEILGKARGITGDNVLQRPDKLRSDIIVDFDGKAISIVVVYDGKKMWHSIDGKTMEIKDEKILAETRESLQVEGAYSLVDFLKAPYELNALGEVKVKDKAAIGVRVSKKGQRDISFFFDKKTHLVVKTEMRAYDPGTGQEVTQEKYLTGYKDRDGMKVPTHAIIEKDGKPFMELDIIETKLLEKVDPANFKMP